MAHDLRLALVAKTCPHRPQAITKRLKMVGVSVGNNFFSSFFLNDATAGTSSHVCKKFHANVPRSDLPMFNIKYLVEHNAKTRFYTKTK